MASDVISGISQEKRSWGYVVGTGDAVKEGWCSKSSVSEGPKRWIWHARDAFIAYSSYFKNNWIGKNAASVLAWWEMVVILVWVLGPVIRTVACDQNAAWRECWNWLGFGLMMVWLRQIVWNRYFRIVIHPLSFSFSRRRILRLYRAKRENWRSREEKHCAAEHKLLFSLDTSSAELYQKACIA